MGNQLEKPIRDKSYEEGSGLGLKYAVCSMQGWREHMEDSHSACIPCDESLNNVSFFAIFDGHAGDFVSNYASKELVPYFVKQMQNDSGIMDLLNDKEMSEEDKNKSLERLQDVIKHVFITFDENMRLLPRFENNQELCGSTAIALIITKNLYVFANCGDSRAILCRGSKCVFETHDHKPNDPEETSRITKAGSTVVLNRVNGNLAVSRALGDYTFKNKTELLPNMQPVSSEPTVSVISRCDKDSFIVLACDGIWDVLTNEDVAALVDSRIAIDCYDIKKICSCVIETCLSKGSQDNMSFLVIMLPGAQKISDEAINKDELLNSTIKKKIDDFVKNSTENANLKTVIQYLQSEEIDGLIKTIGIHSKVELVEKYLNEISPDRPKDQDYPSTSLAPFHLQMLLQRRRDENSLNRF